MPNVENVNNSKHSNAAAMKLGMGGVVVEEKLWEIFWSNRPRVSGER